MSKACRSLPNSKGLVIFCEGAVAIGKSKFMTDLKQYNTSLACQHKPEYMDIVYVHEPDHRWANLHVIGDLASDLYGEDYVREWELTVELITKLRERSATCMFPVIIVERS